MINAITIYSKYADKNGMISIIDLEKLGWNKYKAEEEGLIVKEEYERHTYVSEV